MPEREEVRISKTLYKKGDKVVWSDGKESTVPVGYQVDSVRISAEGQIQYVLSRTYLDRSIGSNPITEKKLCNESELRPDLI